MKLPEILSAGDVADVLVRVGFPVDRQNVARALHEAPVDGVIAPGRIGQGWRVPRSALLDVFATCLWRRAQRERAPRGYGPGSPAAYRVDAAELLMEERELARLVPRSLKQAVRQRWEARRRSWGCSWGGFWELAKPDVSDLNERAECVGAGTACRAPTGIRRHTYPSTCPG